MVLNKHLANHSPAICSTNGRKRGTQTRDQDNHVNSTSTLYKSCLPKRPGARIQGEIFHSRSLLNLMFFCFHQYRLHMNVKSQGTKSKSTSRQSTSKTKAHSKSPAQSTSQSNGTGEQGASFDPLTNYLDDTTHTNPGYRSAGQKPFAPTNDFANDGSYSSWKRIWSCDGLSALCTAGH
jgi:hypothetical protein